MAATIPVSGGPRRKLSCWAEAWESQNRDSGPEMELGSVLMSSKLGNCLIHLWIPATGPSKDVHL